MNTVFTLEMYAIPVSCPNSTIRISLHSLSEYVYMKFIRHIHIHAMRKDIAKWP